MHFLVLLWAIVIPSQSTMLPAQELSWVISLCVRNGRKIKQNDAATAHRGQNRVKDVLKGKQVREREAGRS